MSSERSALILGASRGLGLRLAKGYRERGWNVVATVRSPTAAAALGPGIETLTLDVTKPDEIDAARQRLEGRRFDLVFANAGISLGHGDTLAKATSDDFTRLMVTNAFGPMRCLEAFAPLVKERGTLAVMSSGLGSVANNEAGGWEVYRASKAALNMLLRSFAARHAGEGKTVLAVCPGWSRTDMGGPEAPLDPDDSVRGVIATLDSLAGSGRHAYVDHLGEIVPW